MKTPIFVFEDDDYSCFKNIQDVARNLEAIDVINNIFVAYDSEGRLLELSAQNEFDDITISLAEINPSHQEELKERLILALKFFHQIGKFENIDGLKNKTLNDLVNEIVKFGYE